MAIPPGDLVPDGLRDRGRFVPEPATPDYAAAFCVNPTPSLLLSPDLMVCAVNPAFLQVTGRTREDVLGRQLFEAFPGNPDDPDDDGARKLAESLQAVIASGQPDSTAVQRYDVPGAGGGFVERYWSQRTTPIHDGAGALVGLLHEVVEVTALVHAKGLAEARGIGRLETELLARGQELQRLNRELRLAHDQLRGEALHDHMTGLLIRPVLMEELRQALARLARHPHPVAVLFLDLDRLKWVNDTHGHAAGDELILCTARRLRASVRPSDPVARVGGDEFVVLLPDLVDEQEATLVARRIQAGLAPAHVTADGVRLQPTASIGIAVTSTDAISADTLLDRADTAMYRAKQTGPGRFEVFDPAAYDVVAGRLQAEADLRRGLGQDELLLHYQPIIDLTTGRTHAVEALIRWDHPTRGLLNAAEFIDIAEEGQVRLGDRVIADACRQLARWDAGLGAQGPRQVFCNISAAELGQAELDHRVAEALDDNGLDSGRLVLEVTETSVLAETPSVAASIEELHRIGCELAIDDFGTGHSSLSRLMHLPANILKIDQSFVRELATNREAPAVVSAVLLLAHNLRKTVVAEGVEDAATLVILKELGCTYAQGYHLGRPQSADQLTDQLTGQLTARIS